MYNESQCVYGPQNPLYSVPVSSSQPPLCRFTMPLGSLSSSKLRNLSIYICMQVKFPIYCSISSLNISHSWSAVTSDALGGRPELWHLRIRTKCGEHTARYMWRWLGCRVRIKWFRLSWKHLVTSHVREGCSQHSSWNCKQATLANMELCSRM